MKRVMFVFGTRPEAIKLAPVISELKKNKEFQPIVVVTGQHREMLDQVLKAFDIRTDHDLKIMEEGQTVSDILTRSLTGLQNIVAEEKPDIIIVQGDTSTTFAASLNAFYNKIPLAHLEAGLRTGDKYRPYPEEMNRKLTSSLADIHFAPTVESKKNLEKEDVKKESIYLTGNTVIDALLEVAKKPFDLKSVGIDVTGKSKIVLLTAHRRENLGAPLKSILDAVKFIAEKHSDQIKIIVPVHKNPKVMRSVQEALGNIPNVQLVDPLDYIPFVHLMRTCYFILTDSGGIQEEAPSFGKPVLVLRDVTERPEGVLAGAVKLVGTESKKIISEAEKLIEGKNEYKKLSHVKNPYGDGHASERIVNALLHYFGVTKKRPEEFKIA